MRSKPIIRQLLFFVLAVFLPSVVLLSFGVVLLRQETELNERRLDELTTFAARDAADSLFQILESAYREVGEVGVRRSGTSPPLLLIGRVENGTLTLFGKQAEKGRHPLDDRSFRDFLRSTSQEELGRSPLGDVVSRYERWLRQETSPEKQAFLELRIARALEKAGNQASREWDVRLLQRPSEVLDEYGSPMAFYAADRLLRAGSHTEEVASRIRTDLNSNAWFSEEAVLFLSDLMAVSGWSVGQDSLAFNQLLEDGRIAGAVEERFRVIPEIDDPAPVWVVIPGENWMVRRLPVGTTGPVVAVNVDWLSASAIPHVSGIQSGTAAAGAERNMSPHFAGMNVTIDAATLPLGNGNQGFLIAGLIMVLGLTLFGGFLLWRDVRRETRLSQLRSQFVSSVSHELRTPLTSIRLFAETLLEHGGNDQLERERSLSIIANESDRLTRMLNNVLNTSRIEQGTMAYRPEYGELSEVVHRSAEAMEYAFRQAGVELAVSAEPVWTTFEADAMEQAIINLLSNALKYGSSGKKVSLTCSRNGTHAHLVVSDEGPGITLEEQGRIFERFYRAERFDDRRVTGAGLGLALVQHIAEGHGGSISVESVPGKGASFLLSIPLLSS